MLKKCDQHETWCHTEKFGPKHCSRLDGGWTSTKPTFARGVVLVPSRPRGGQICAFLDHQSLHIYYQSSASAFRPPLRCCRSDEILSDMSQRSRKRAYDQISVSEVEGDESNFHSPASKRTRHVGFVNSKILLKFAPPFRIALIGDANNFLASS
jgi:hypothetical protein